MQIHSTYRESIHELIDGTIGAIRRAELERHLADCAECRSLLADMETLRNTADAPKPLLDPEQRHADEVAAHEVVEAVETETK